MFNRRGEKGRDSLWENGIDLKIGFLQLQITTLLLVKWRYPQMGGTQKCYDIRSGDLNTGGMAEHSIKL